jgi:hypothetical protein
MRDTVRRDQLRLFAELVETQTTRDRVTDDGVWMRPPHRPRLARARCPSRAAYQMDASAGGVAAAVEAAMLTAGQSKLHRISWNSESANRCPRANRI